MYCSSPHASPNAPMQGLVDALLELRKRRLRERPTKRKGGSKYALLPSSGT